MDERQQQVQVGAGLQESRLNTEFIAFLQKYGTYILYALLVVVLAYVGLQKWNIHKQKQLDKAFTELAASLVSGNPDNMLKVASENDGRGAVWELASLSAAERYLDSAQRGLAPGADFQNPAEADRLSDAQIKEYIEKATAKLKEVLTRTQSTSAQILLAQRVRWNLATAALNTGDKATAKSYIEQYINAAEKAGLVDQASHAKKRLEMLDSVMASTTLLSEADLPESARPPKPVAPSLAEDASRFKAEGGEGRPISVTREELEAMAGGPIPGLTTPATTPPPGTDALGQPLPPAPESAPPAAVPAPTTPPPAEPAPKENP